jgi:hypothetical protein
MTAELTAEQIVTSLLSSNEILKPKEERCFMSNSSLDLNKYLLNQPTIIYTEEPTEEFSKYTFIKGKWEI